MSNFIETVWLKPPPVEILLAPTRFHRITIICDLETTILEEPSKALLPGTVHLAQLKLLIWEANLLALEAFLTE